LFLVGFVYIGLKLLSDSKSRFQTKIDELKESRDAEAAHKKQKLEAILAVLQLAVAIARLVLRTQKTHSFSALLFLLLF
jgi:hypothetical protein